MEDNIPTYHFPFYFVLQSLLEAIERRSKPDGARGYHTQGPDGQSDTVKQAPGRGPSNPANRVLPSVLPNPQSGSSGIHGTAIGRTIGAQNNAMDVDDDEVGSARKKLKGSDGTSITPQSSSGGGVPSLLSRLVLASPAPSSKAHTTSKEAKNRAKSQTDVSALRPRVGGKLADVGAIVKSGSTSDLLSHAMGDSLRSRGV